MFTWVKQQVANVAGTQEPIYGPSAIKSIAEEAKDTPYSELEREDLKWLAMDSTCLESNQFYLMSDNGHFALAQIIYSNVAGIHTTCQFNTKIIYPESSDKEHLWCSTPLKNHEFSEDMNSFYATDCAMELSEDGNSYSIKSMTDDRAIVNLTVTRQAPGFQAGKTGKTLFGTDLEHPWGTMRHAFWPRCTAEGTISTKEGPIDFKGKAFFSHALQGMKPHHAAARWNFVDFQGPEYSAIIMEYTTPPSYGSTVVGVGVIAKDGKIIVGGCDVRAEHVTFKEDSENDWKEPITVKYTWTGLTNDGKKVEAVLEGALGERLDRIDVMAEVPGFVKKFVAGTVGTKPYIYQYMPRKAPLNLKLKVGDESEITAPGELFTEATFISE